MKSELVSRPAWARSVAPQSVCAISAGPGPEPSAHGASVRTADIFTAREILRLRMSVDQGQDGDPTAEYYWAELLKDCAEADVFTAAWDHYRNHSRPLWPADILRWVRIASERRLDGAVEHRGQGLAKRASGGWGAVALERWAAIVDEQISRGANPEAATKTADSETESCNSGLADSVEYVSEHSEDQREAGR